MYNDTVCALMRMGLATQPKCRVKQLRGKTNRKFVFSLSEAMPRCFCYLPSLQNPSQNDCFFPAHTWCAEGMFCQGSLAWTPAVKRKRCLHLKFGSWNFYLYLVSIICILLISVMGSACFALHAAAGGGRRSCYWPGSASFEASLDRLNNSENRRCTLNMYRLL